MAKNRGLSPIKFDLVPDHDNYAVLGNPVAHSKSPRIHRLFAGQTSQAISYQAIQVPEDRFAATVHAFQRVGGKGLNITLPFKEEAWKLATSRTGRAELAGAVNTLWFADDGQIHGDNTDGAGLMRDFQHNGITVSAGRVLILGAGGAVRGILGPLLENNPVEVVIANRTLARAQSLVERYSHAGKLRACRLDELAAAGRFNLIINALSSGLQGELPPLPATLTAERCSGYDMVYGDAETVFTGWAKRHGAIPALDGLGMLVEQAAESFYIWRGVRPDTTPVLELLSEERRVRGGE